MNKIILSGISLSLLLGATGAFAADVPPPPPPPDRPMLENVVKAPRFSPKHFEEKLHLTKEQKERAKEIREEGREKLKPIMEEMKALRKKADEIRKDNMEEFEKILTPEQRKILKSFEKGRHKKPIKPHKDID